MLSSVKEGAEHVQPMNHESFFQAERERERETDRQRNIDKCPCYIFKYDDIIQRTQSAFRQFTCRSIELNYTVQFKMVQYDFNKVYVGETKTKNIDSSSIF